MPPTWGDTAREIVRQRGLLYFSDVLADIGARLPSIPHATIAAACAERLLTRHLRLPVARQRPFTASWRHPMDCIWSVLSGNPGAARFRSEIADALQRYYDSPLNHNDGQNGPNAADHDPAAACIYAAESLIHDSPKSVGYAVSRLLDDAFSQAANERELVRPATGQMDDFIEDCCHPVVQRELQWIQQLISYVESHPLTDETVTEVRNRAQT